MDGRDAGVRVEGLREFRRDLKRLSPDVDRGLDKELREGADSVKREAQTQAPKLTGEYARSFRVYKTRGGYSVGSRLPQAGVLHWGGTIRPKGTAITFPRRAVVYDAALRQADGMVDDVADAFDRAARKAGWH